MKQKMKKEFKILGKDIKRKPKIELSKRNIPQYIREKVQPHLPFGRIKNILVEEVATGFCNVNFVFEVNLDTAKGKKTIFIKQARPYVKINPEMSFDPKRSYYEYKTIQLLDKIWRKGVVPKVYYYDKEDFVMIMGDLKQKGEVLAVELKKGIVRPEVGRRFGELVGILHGKTFRKKIIIRNKREDKDMFEFNYAFRTAGAMKFAEAEVRKIVAESKKVKRVFIISDLASKNTFVEGSEVRLYDFEGAHMGDPAWDVGFVLGHFMLEAAHRPEIKEKVKKLITDFMKSYKKKIKKYGFSQKEIRGIEQRATKFMGATMLHRIAGGVKKGKKVYKAYISKEKLSEIKNIAVTLLRGIYSKPEEAILTLIK